MSQRIEGSGSGSLAGSDLMSIVKGAVIAGLAAGIPTIIDYLGGLQIVDPKSAAIVAVVAIVLNIVRKWLTNTQQQVTRLALLAALCGLVLSALPAQAHAADATPQSSIRNPQSAFVLQPAVFRRSVHIERDRYGRRWPIARGLTRGTAAVGRGAAAVGRGVFRAGRFVLPPYGGRR